MTRRAGPLLMLALVGCGGPQASGPANARAQAGETKPRADVSYDAEVRRRDQDERGTRALAGGESGKCAFEGWSIDRDPAGLNVRAGPSTDARIVGRLPPFDGEDAGGVVLGRGPGFTIVEARNGWFYIDRAYGYAADGETMRDLPMRGWISGRHIGFGLQTEKAFAAPDLRAPVVTTAGEDGAGRFVELRHRYPSDCKGEWVKLRVAGLDRIEREAWVSGVCGNQETTCDGGVYGVMLDGRIE